jgi:hypothetical protein
VIVSGVSAGGSGTDASVGDGLSLAWRQVTAAGQILLLPCVAPADFPLFDQTNGIAPLTDGSLTGCERLA